MGCISPCALYVRLSSLRSTLSYTGVRDMVGGVDEVTRIHDHTPLGCRCVVIVDFFVHAMFFCVCDAPPTTAELFFHSNTSLASRVAAPPAHRTAHSSNTKAHSPERIAPGPTPPPPNAVWILSESCAYRHSNIHRHTTRLLTWFIHTFPFRSHPTRRPPACMLSPPQLLHQ